MFNFNTKIVGNLLSSYTFINRNKIFLGWISIGGLSMYTYLLYNQYCDSGSYTPYLIHYQPSYSGILYSIKYLNNIYNKTLEFWRVQHLTDVKYERFIHLLDVKKYKDLYLKKLLLMKSHDKTESVIEDEKVYNLNTHKNILFESTPRGNVIVFFNDDYKQFHYYSDYSLPYDIIDNVLQKYVVTFHCTELYNTNRCDIDTLQLDDNNNSKAVNESNQTTNTVQQKTKDKYPNVYAKLKKNNTNRLATNKDLNKDVNKNINTKHTKYTNSKNANGKMTNDIKEELIIYHKMKHCGKLRDFDFKRFQTNMNHKEMNATQSNNNVENVKAISYKDFKS